MSGISGKRKMKKVLSADELKSKLYAHFEEIGSLDQIKTQLRGELYAKLLKSTPNDFPETVQDLQDFDKLLLPLQVSNWLVFDHLLRQDYQYTLSTFTSEAKLSSPEKLLTACDVLRLFGLENTSSGFRIISNKYVTTNEKGVLNSLLLAVIKCMLEIPNKNFKLNDLLSGTEMKNSVPVDYKENSGNQEKNSQSNIKRKTSDSSFIEKTSFSLHQLTADTEKSFQEQLQFIKNEKEKEMQKLREKLLEELDRLRTIQLELEHKKNDLNRQRTSDFHIRDFLQEKMLLEKELESRFQKELHEVEIDFKSQLHLKEMEMDSLQKQNVAKGQKLFELEVDLRSYKERCNDFEKDLADQREMYKVIQEKYSLLLEENIKLQKNFEGMSDYSILKDQLNIKIKENIELQNKLKEAVRNAESENQKFNETLKDLDQKLKSKGPELLQAQKEVIFTKETLHKQETSWDKERKKLEQELQNSKQMYNTVFLRLEDHREDIHDLHKMIHFLQYQISNTFPIDKTKSEMLPKYTSAESTGKRIRDFRSKYNKSLGDVASRRENSVNFISEAKGRIDRLEKETEMVKDKCSFIFSNTAQRKTDFKYLDFNSTTPKTTFSNIRNFPNSSLTNLTYSHFPSNYFDNLVKNEMSFINLRTATNIKRMVSNSQFSTNGFSHGQPNEEMKSRDDQATEGTVDSSKELGKEQLVLNDSFSEKQAISTNLFNSSNTKVKSLHNEIPLASLNFNSIMAPGIETNKSLKNNETFNKSANMSEELGKMQETRPSISETMSVSETAQNKDVPADSNEKTPIKHEGNSIPPLTAIDLDIAWVQNKTLLELPKKLDGVTVLESNENKTIMEAEDDAGPSSSFVVDLDAAWKKRKSSMTDLFSQNSRPNLELQNSIFSEENDNSETLLLKVSPQQDNLGMNTQNLKHVKNDNRTTDGIQASLDENKPEFVAAERNTPKVIQNLDTNLIEEATFKEVDKESGDGNNKSLIDHQKASQNIAMEQNENRSLKSGSGSELSDVQLSCGSEQEAKDDDFW